MRRLGRRAAALLTSTPSSASWEQSNEHDTADEIREATPEQVQRARQYAIRRYEDAGLPHLADEARAGKWDVSTMVYGALRAIIDGDAALAAEKARADAAEAVLALSREMLRRHEGAISIEGDVFKVIDAALGGQP